MKQTTEQRQILIDAATQLIDQVKDPYLGLFLIMETESKVHDYVRDTKMKERQDPYYFLTILAERVIVPWLKGGSKTIEEMADGLNAIYELDHFEGFENTLQQVLNAYGHDRGMVGQESWAISLNWINALHKVSHKLYQYEKALESCQSA